MVKRTSNKKHKKPNNTIIIASPLKKNVQLVDENHNGIISAKSINSIAEKMVDCNNIKVIDSLTGPYFDAGFMGLLGSHYALRIKVLNNKKEETVNAFIKTIPYEDKIRSQYVICEGIFAKELEFYNEICPFLYAYHKGERWSPLNFPVAEDALVLEDLYTQGYKMYPNWLNDTKVMKAALNALARFHGCSILAEAYYARKESKVSRLNDIYRETLRETAYAESLRNHEWIILSIKLACSLYSHFTGSEESAEMYSIMNRIFDLIRPHVAYRNVICHGDLWWNNLLFQSTGETTKCMLVDFQMVRYAPQVHDVLQLMYLHSTRDWRQRYEKEMLSYYHHILGETVSASPLSNFATVPSYDDLEFAYNDLRIYGLIVACLYLPFSLMDKNLLNDCARNKKAAEEFTWYTRLEVTKEYLTKNIETGRLIKEVILETCDHCDLIYNYEIYRDLTIMERFDDNNQ